MVARGGARRRSGRQPEHRAGYNAPMTPPALSVIITTSPGREANLAGCLASLARQRQSPGFEVLVCDDGSTAGEATAADWQQQLNLRYLWRPNDMCLNRSRNAGLAVARGRRIVVISGDVLLNPLALAAYDAHLQAGAGRLWSGYFGYLRYYVAPSTLIPGRLVNYLDKRFFGYGTDRLLPLPHLAQHPEEFFWGGSLAFERGDLDAIGGFDEAFVGWGYEDVAFGRKLLQAGLQLHFSLDAWGEHQLHRFDEVFHQPEVSPNAGLLAASTPAPPAAYAVQLAASPETLRDFAARLFGAYLQQDQRVDVELRAAFRQPDRLMLIRQNPDYSWQMAWAQPQP